jgi:demethylmenaquinone methyltransferase/2-methoxy-6-polyprenyl-1,4-benzoquinol methylase
LEIARSKSYPQNNVKFSNTDLYEFNTGKYDGLFGGFIASHIRLQEINNFIKVISKFVNPGGKIVLLDNKYVDGSSSPIIYTDESGNTYQKRKLTDGSEHIIVKNFLTIDYLHNLLEKRFKDIEFIDMKYYWVLSFDNMH